jgi:flagellar hook-associated protein 1 FlgK
MTVLEDRMQVTGTGIPTGTFIKKDIAAGTFTLVTATGAPVNASVTVIAPGTALTFDGTAAAFAINPLMTTDTIAASLNNSAAGDNQNAAAIARLNSQRHMPPGVATPTLTFSGYWNALVSEMGLDVNSSKTNVAQDEAFNNQLNILKDTNAGVSLDQELSDMMMYQRSYQACAQVISTATAMMDILLGIVR